MKLPDITDTNEIPPKMWDQIMEEAKTRPDNEANVMIWGLLFKLDKWTMMYMRNPENPDDINDVGPLTSVYDGARTVFAFTSRDHVSWAIEHKFEPVEGGRLAIEFDPAEAMDMFTSMAKGGINKILFNVNGNGWLWNIGELPAIYGWHKKNDPRFKGL